LSGRPQGNDVSFWQISCASLNRDFNQLDDRITINYARVSSHDQKADLVRQAQVLEAFSATNGWQFETIQDLGSGLNFRG
jgi:predicted site-specific integrase-resolvase